MAALEALIASRGLKVGTLNATQAVDVILEFYATERADGTVRLDEDGDMLLYEFGVFDWGEGPSFEFGLTRQFIQASAVDDDAMSQLELILHYEASDDARDVGHSAVWCHHPDNISEFRAVIESSAAMGFVRGRRVHRTTLRYEHV